MHHSKKTVLLSALIAATLSSHASVHAMQKKDADGIHTLPVFHVYAYKLGDTSTVGTKSATVLKKIPASVTIVNSDEMDRLGVYNLTDALEYNAGITVAPRGYDALYNFSSIRGFSISHNNIVVNGMKAFGTTDNLFSPELYGVDQVEILRGPASVLYGSGSVSGTVNLQTKHPKNENFGEAQIRFGNRNEKMTALDINRTDENGTLYGRLTALWKQQDLFYDQTKQDRFYAAPSLTKEWRNTKLTILPFYQKDKIKGNAYLPRTRLPGDPLYNLLPDRFFIGVPGWDKYELTQKGIGYELEHRLNNGVTFHQKGNYRKSEILSHQTSGIYVAAENQMNRWGAMIDSEARSYGIDQYIQIHNEKENISNDTLIGFDLRYEKTFDKQSMRMLNAWKKSDLQDYVAGKPVPNDPDAIMPMDSLRYWSHEKGIYAIHTLKKNRFTFSTGLRKGFYSRHSDRDEQEFEQNAWTGQAGLVYEINDKWTPYLHWHNSFSPLMNLDKDKHMLDPTTGQEWELGIRYTPTASVQVTASVFDLRRQNIHVPVPETTYFTSIGEITSQGMEIEGRAKLNDRLYILGSYTYMNPRVTKNTVPARIGKQPAGVAKQSFNLRADAILGKFDNGELTLGLGLRHIGKRMDETNTLHLGGVTLYDASLSFTRNRHALTLHARNIFNKKYISNIESVWGIPTGFAGQERTWILSYIYKW